MKTLYTVIILAAVTVAIQALATAQRARDWGAPESAVIQSIQQHPREVYEWLTANATDEQFTSLKSLLAPTLAQKEARDPAALAADYANAIQAMERIGLDTRTQRTALERIQEILRRELTGQVEAAPVVERVRP